MSLVLLSLLLVILIVVSAFFSGSEIGVMSLNRYRLRYLVKQNNKSAIRINNLLKKPDRLLSVVIIGSTLCNIVASTVATLIGQQLYGNTGVAIATLLLTLVVLIFAEMIPKTMAALYSQQVAFSASFLLIIFKTLFAPLVYVISWFTEGFLRIIGISLNPSQREALTGDELRSVVNEASGLMPSEHKNRLLGLLDLDGATVEDIMIPLADVVGIDLNRSWHEILDQLETAQHTRLPVYKDSMETLIGIVHVRSILNLSLEEELTKENLLKIVEDPYFIPAGTVLNQQISNFQKSKKRSCFVVNEYGDIQGLVTLEDILEEVIGEFTTDISNFSKDIIQQEGNNVVVDASITLRNLKRLLGWQLPELGPRTLSGLIIEYLGYIPPADCCLKLADFQIEILKIGDNMIKTVKMTKV